MKTFLLFILICGASFAARAATTNNPLVALGNTNGFGVQFALTEDKNLFTNWNQPVTPHYQAVSVVKRGVPVFTVVVVAGVGTGPDGKADVTFEAVIRKPDGSIYGRQTDLIGIRDRIDPSAKALQLCSEYMGIRIEPEDSAGIYTAEVIVKDNVKKVELRLTRTFTVDK